VLVKNTASSPGGKRREHAGQRRVVQLNAVDEIGRERGSQNILHVGVIVAQTGEALAGVEVEVLAAVGVIEAGPRGGHVLPVEAEDPQHVDERRIQMAGGQIERLVSARLRLRNDPQ
jgi:hypothetical protein